MKAIWNDEIIAESSDTVVVEGNHYFPRGTVKHEFLIESDTRTYCPWKGYASYFHIKVAGDVNKDAAWYYPETKPEAEKIRDRIAFWRGVEVTE